MKEIREVAKAYYNGAEEDEKKMAQQFFQKLDENGDGKVSLASFKRKADPSFPYTEHNFRLLDENGDGTLDFEEVLALYYLTKVPITSCSVCSSMLLGSYFSCLRCQGKNSYCLCCHCYGRRRFDHHHPSDDFADTRAQLTLLEQLLGQEQVPRNRRDIFDQEVMNDNNAKRNSASAKTPTNTKKLHANIVKAFREGFDQGSANAMDPEEVVKLVVDMMNNGEEAPEEEIGNNDDEGFDMNDVVEALDEGIDVNDAVEALDQGIDILDAVVEVASTAASCSIM